MVTSILKVSQLQDGVTSRGGNSQKRKTLIGYAPHGGLFSVTPRRKKIKAKPLTSPQKPVLASSFSQGTNDLEIPVPDSPSEDNYSTADEGGSEVGEGKEGNEEASTLASSKVIEPLTQTEPINVAETTAATDEPGTADTANAWKVALQSDLAKGNRLGAQRRLKSLLSEYFVIDPSNHELILADDGTTRVRGSNMQSILNFMIPQKKIHPKTKPTGLAAVIEVLRLRGLYDAAVFPNNSVALIFNEYKDKPSAYQSRLTNLDKQLKLISKISASLNYDEKTAAATQTKDWATFN